MRLFALQLHQDTVLSVNIDVTTVADRVLDGGLTDSGPLPSHMEGSTLSLKKQLARVVMGVWRYYEQFLPAVRRFQDLLRYKLLLIMYMCIHICWLLITLMRN